MLTFIASTPAKGNADSLQQAWLTIPDSLLDEDRLVDAARILGFSETRLEEIGEHRQKVDQMVVEHYLTECRERLGKQKFDRAWQAGAQLTLEEAFEVVSAKETGVTGIQD